MSVESYRDLLVWKKGMELVKSIYALTKQFPKEELYGLTSQMRRSAVSVPSNIAEGNAKRSTRDYIRFLGLAYGSICELETQLLIAKDLGYCLLEDTDNALNVCSEIGRMLNGLIRRLEQKLTDPRPLTPDPQADPRPLTPNPYQYA